MYAGTLKWSLRRERDGWRLELILPGGLIAAGKATTKRDALHKAASLAETAIASPMVQATLPPGTAAAVKVAADIARNPAVARVVRDVGPKAAKKLVKAISSWW